MLNKETNVSLAVIFNNARSVIHCSVKCFNDYCCEAYIYQNKNGQCFGIHSVKKEGYSFHQFYRYHYCFAKVIKLLLQK